MRLTIAICLAALLLGSPAFATGQTEPAESAVSKARDLEQEIVGQGRETATSTEPITEHEVQAVDPAGAGPLDDAITCLARTIYWEAKGESTDDMEAVANVVVNRLGHGDFPSTVCEVVKEGSEQGTCQFSWWCDGRPDDTAEDEPYENAKEVARQALNGELADRTDGALYFHDRNVAPNWGNEFIKTLEGGAFVFYKPHSE